MTIYNIIPVNDSEFCNPVNDDDFEKIEDLIDGTPRVRSWKPFVMRLWRTDSGRRLKYSDCPSYGPHVPIFRERAIAALGALLRAHGELLPLVCEEADVMMYNITRVLPAIDEAASGVTYWENGGIETVERYVFRPDVIAGSDIFKLANLPLSPAFVTLPFVDMWRAAGLQGAAFKEARRLA